MIRIRWYMNRKRVCAILATSNTEIYNSGASTGAATGIVGTDGADVGEGTEAGAGDGLAAPGAPLPEFPRPTPLGSNRNANSGVSITAAFSLAYPAHTLTTSCSPVSCILTVSSRFLATARVPSHMELLPRNLPPSVVWVRYCVLGGKYDWPLSFVADAIILT